MKKIIGFLAMCLLFTPLALFCAPKDTANPRLVWDANAESDLAGYVVYYNESAQGLTDPSVMQHKIVGTPSNPQAALKGLNVAENVEYIYAVTAYDNAGNESGFSNTVVFTADFTPPSDPSGCRMEE